MATNRERKLRPRCSTKTNPGQFVRIPIRAEQKNGKRETKAERLVENLRNNDKTEKMTRVVKLFSEMTHSLPHYHLISTATVRCQALKSTYAFV